ncbi:CRISPR-associated protein Csn2-St [Companilactobacillus keshanensis]|uniref:CRISPR-associated protein Csn2-St n=1 Tax=Companilactobacillus keshanensis TaxID=2486003 RepID=A0ABW4BWH0_9LACO|nr:CRISPR-associated protein Csn2-St [Companilactobacillus keshanensis]
MILKIELENQKFLDLDFDDIVYLTGIDHKKLWTVFRSLYYYFNRSPRLTSNIYGDNDIELYIDDEKVSVKNNDVFFINNRDSIYQQMQYKKDTLLYELLNKLNDDLDIDHAIENMNNENFRLEIKVQEFLDDYSNNLRINFQDLNYLEMLKNFLVLNYQEDSKNYPLEFMNTESLLDEFLNFLKLKLSKNSHPTWLVLYNVDSFISQYEKNNFFIKIKKLLSEYDLKVVYIGNNLENLPIDTMDLEKIVVAADEFDQLLPTDELLHSVKNNYPNEFNSSEEKFVESMQRIIPYIGIKEKLFLNNKDLVLLKVVNEILNYETSFSFEDQLLTDAETKFLED